MFNLKKFISDCIRVFRVATKPTKDEFKLASKITALGIVIIGIIGFIVFMIFHLIGV